MPFSHANTTHFKAEFSWDYAERVARLRVEDLQVLEYPEEEKALFKYMLSKCYNIDQHQDYESVMAQILARIRQEADPSGPGS